MADIDALYRLIGSEATALGFALVRVRVFGTGDERTLQIMAERPDTRQLTIEDCSELSRRLSDKLDEAEANGTDPIDGAYRLEVSSPGIDRPLTRRQDYADWTGHEAKLTVAEPIDGQKQFRGEIEGIDPEGVVALHTKAGANAFIPFEAITDAKLVLTDALIAATVPLSMEGADDLVELSADADGTFEIEDTEEETH